ncbi:hypothetical protein C0992_009125 [Termitomyces sp. T32_za158]|nr:hypothetical protein C0992_009125 [Termitomyces sp. T32_za158]
MVFPEYKQETQRTKYEIISAAQDFHPLRIYKLERKRKHRNLGGVVRSNQNSDPHSNSFAVPESNTGTGLDLYVQAYEADIIRGPAAKISAASLEAPLPGTIETGGALIKWGAQTQLTITQDEDMVCTRATGDQNVIWVDRYDARLLLDTLPNPSETLQNLPDSPRGWSDVPSDNEDVFFLGPEEVEDFRRDKKRQHLEQLREERLRARRKEDGESSDDEAWGDSDEEPTNTQRDLMERTASHLLSSPNPTQLEARILANHGKDIRFAFLRGRWSRAWENIKGKMSKDNEQAQDRKNTSGLGDLAGYGSDADSDEAEVPAQPVVLQSTASPASQGSRADIREARRARAKEWVKKRRSLGSS